ncbi:hypothetical protein MRB53_005626 [Persea americana]|uniref:Uncharacterized protein n=1 Tax=Persea americana TaxID=3435 RepID=A0ACC2MEE0_PERAE|nr:hypothetical protein MRB53_005626 [Persea americana]
MKINTTKGWLIADVETILTLESLTQELSPYFPPDVFDAERIAPPSRFVPTLSSSRFPSSRATLAVAKSSSFSINREEFRSNSGLD